MTCEARAKIKIQFQVNLLFTFVLNTIVSRQKNEISQLKSI